MVSDFTCRATGLKGLGSKVWRVYGRGFRFPSFTTRVLISDPFKGTL